MIKTMINLQLFANDVEKVKGTQIIYLYRLLSEKSKEDATHIAFSEENELSMRLLPNLSLPKAIRSLISLNKLCYQEKS